MNVIFDIFGPAKNPDNLVGDLSEQTEASRVIDSPEWSQTDIFAHLLERMHRHDMAPSFGDIEQLIVGVDIDILEELEAVVERLNDTYDDADMELEVQIRTATKFLDSDEHDFGDDFGAAFKRAYKDRGYQLTSDEIDELPTADAYVLARSQGRSGNILQRNALRHGLQAITVPTDNLIDWEAVRAQSSSDGGNTDGAEDNATPAPQGGSDEHSDSGPENECPDCGEAFNSEAALCTHIEFASCQITDAKAADLGIA